MSFTDGELGYMTDRPLGRLATIGPSGAPQVKPVAFEIDHDSRTLVVGMPDPDNSQMLRNVRAEPRVSFVVDDVAEEPVGPGGQRGRGLEIRGQAKIERLDRPVMDGLSRDIIRVEPRRVVVWNVDGPHGDARDVFP